MSQLTAIRILNADEPAGPLLKAVEDISQGQCNKIIYEVDPMSFRKVSNAPFAYWVSDKIRKIFTTLPPFEGSNKTVKVGLQTSDNDRFIRTTWEIGSDLMSKNWVPFAKGGSYSPFYEDIHLNVKWSNEGKEIQQFHQSVVRNPDFYFKPGIIFPRRTRRFCPKVFPRGIIFSNAGQVAFAPGKELVAAAILSSLPCQTFIFCSLGANPQDAGGTNPQFEVGVIQKTPFKLTDKIEMAVKPLAKSAWSTKRSTDTANQTSHAFYAPALSPGQFGSRNKKATTT